MILELNACMGGMTEGFRRAGIRVDVAVDWDPDACESHDRNLGLRPLQRDIRELADEAESGAWRPRVDLLIADPPCTPWSLAGARQGLSDDRDLLRATMRIISALRPRCWLLGNVPGLDTRPNAAALEAAVLRPARAAGYVVDYTSLDAADYGTPQRRRRPFWFGRPANSPPIRWAPPTHAAPPILPGLGLRPHVTIREALTATFGAPPWGSEVGRVTRLRLRRNNNDSHASRLDRPARTITVGASGGDGGTIRTIDPNRPPADLDAVHRTVTTTRELAIVRLDAALEAASLADRPSTTIACDDRLPAAGYHHPHLRGVSQQYSGIVLSERALLALQGFPPHWHVAGETKRARMAQIGQAMPPQLAHAVATSIAEWQRKQQGANEARG